VSLTAVRRRSWWHRHLAGAMHRLEACATNGGEPGDRPMIRCGGTVIGRPVTAATLEAAVAKRRAGTPAPRAFSCFTAGAKAND
jgi:hypothetical protein